MNNGDALTKLADIIPPAPPAPLAWWPWLIAAFFIAALAVFAWWWRSRRRAVAASPLDRRVEALAALNNLHEEWTAKRIDDRDAAYRLATVLRLGLGLAQLSDEPPPVAVNEAPLWRDALAQLNRQRYPAARGQALPPALFEHARRWLAGER